MAIYVGIDLGTTNSAICTYDGKHTQVWKSPEQNDVTPSAIYIDRRGNTQYGQRAYNAAPMAPGNAANVAGLCAKHGRLRSRTFLHLHGTGEDLTVEHIAHRGETLFGHRINRQNVHLVGFAV